MQPFENQQSAPPQSRGMQALVPGLILVGIGGLFLLDNLGIIHSNNLLSYWPVVLIAVGLVQVADSTYGHGRMMGGCVAAAGTAILASNLGYIPFNVWDLWPLALIAAGVYMIWQRTSEQPQNRSRWRTGPFMRMGSIRRPTDTSGNGDNVIHEFTMFGGSRRTVTSANFQGGTISAVMGGVNLDLTGSIMSGNAAVLNVSSVYGGISVRVPTTWTVEMRGSGIFGGFSDHTLHPPASPDAQRLIVKGAAIFGGIVVKN